MKKNLSKAMAAAMAVAAVAPAVAQPVVVDAAGITRESQLITATPDQTAQFNATTSFTVEVRHVNGYELAKTTTATTDGSEFIFSRSEAFDGNLTEYVADDTLKEVFGEGAIIVATKEGTATNLSGHKYVIGKKLSQAKIDEAKLQQSKVNADIERLKTAGYTITEEVVQGEGFTTTGSSTKTLIYQEGIKVITATNSSNNTYKFVFKGVVDAKTPVTVTSLQEAFEGLKYNFAGKTNPNCITSTSTTDFTLEVATTKDTSLVKDRYFNLNSLIMFLNTNAEKFDIVKTENSLRTQMVLKVYQKGLKGVDRGLVQTITLNGIDKLDKDQVLGQLGKTDFAGHWAETEIKTAMVNGWVDNSNTFRPNDSVTRAEFAKMVCTIFNIDTDEDTIDNLNEPFNDVKEGDWHYKYIVALYNYKAGANQVETSGATTSSLVSKGAIVNGYEDETFKPNAKITREEAAKMMAAAYELAAINTVNYTSSATASILYVEENDKDDKKTDFYDGTKIDKVLNGIVDSVLVGKNGVKIHRDIKTVFTDDKDIAVWADESVATLNEKGVIGGNPDGTFKPKSQITRAEALAMVMRSAK